MAAQAIFLLGLAAAGQAAPSMKDFHRGCQGEKTTPEQLHFNYAGDRGMTISWNTKAKLEFPAVRYGRDRWLDQMVFSEVSVTYPTSTTYSNHVFIDGLEPDTEYSFSVLCADENDHHQFKTSIAPGNPRPYTFAFIGDLGTMGPLGLADYGQEDALSLGEITTMQSLSQFKDQFEFVWHGNHEANCDNGGSGPYTDSICMEGQTNFTGFRNHFRMPSPQSGGLENFWFSWDSGLFLDAPDLPGGSGDENAGPFAPNGTQIEWLKKDLASVDRKKTPWIIVAGHRPWYVDDSKCGSCQTAFEPLLLEYGVDIALFGHKHFYERLTPIASDTPDPKGLNNPSAPWYLVNGAAGHYEGLSSVDTPYENYTVKAIDTVYGWSRFTVHNCTHITQDFIGKKLWP
ncbi:hypothetical protein N7478_007923 [Penicillium angulare]|uniref:uncharacterized protein n=1 Tax=Penicillium angulare TaxID=116970 RepID=UPI0025421583|nr:uncharacterized protein N7478_007923 [Penicillium angulare]KAJ5272798.1 hypothetical protein N7478_007923 [Penicillium angulare]